MRDGYTRTFSVEEEGRGMVVSRTLYEIYELLHEKGYDPVSQIVGYLVTEDPTYITAYGGARALVCKLDRYEVLKFLVSFYLKKNHKEILK
ncbi:MAG: IreB family regulatory phosphoprotein [Oscillospiraceae bacterium]|jgi:uncharacterized protein (UPF0297 family)|nr:IreB family regulatory phosphoprotein [Oscillospiraceae bacterium]